MANLNNVREELENGSSDVHTATTPVVLMYYQLVL